MSSSSEKRKTKTKVQVHIEESKKEIPKYIPEAKSANPSVPRPKRFISEFNDKD